MAPHPVLYILEYGKDDGMMLLQVTILPKLVISVLLENSWGGSDEGRCHVKEDPMTKIWGWRFKLTNLSSEGTRILAQHPLENLKLCQKHHVNDLGKIP